MNVSRFVPIVANQALALLLGVVGLKLTSLLVAPADYGHYAIFLTLTQIGVLLTHSGLINLVSRHWQKDSEQAGTLARFAWNRSWKALRWLGPAILMLVLGLYAVTRDLAWLYVVAPLIVANSALAITEVGAAALNASERHWWLLALRTTATATRLSVPLLLVLAAGANYLVLVAGFSLHCLFMIPLAALALRAHPSSTLAEQARDGASWDSRLRTYGRPFALLGVGGWLLLNADRWIVERLFGADQAGQFAMAAGIGGVVPLFFLSVLMQAFFPIAFREADAARSPADWKRLARKCDLMTAGFLLATLVALGALSLLGPALVGGLVAPSYAPAVRILFVSGLAMASVQANQFQFLLLQGRHDSRAMVRVMIVVAAVKTVGSVATALISWDLFIGWLGMSVLVCAVLGRGLVRRTVFGQDREDGWPVMAKGK
jgi:O-antigen/teichoic acid export membrane protein